jgi:hypothetical protein
MPSSQGRAKPHSLEVESEATQGPAYTVSYSDNLLLTLTTQPVAALTPAQHLEQAEQADRVELVVRQLASSSALVHLRQRLLLGANGWADLTSWRRQQ